MSTALSLLRRHVFAVVALLLLTAGGAYGVAGQVGDPDRSGQKRVFACVDLTSHVMTKTTVKRGCPEGSRTISWSAVGATGATGATGAAGVAGAPGARGADGANGVAGQQGQQGTPGAAGVSEYAEFFARGLDNPGPIAPGDPILFQQNGPTSGTITRVGADTITLPDVGTYRVSFSVPVNEAGQLVVALDGVELVYTASGRATGTTTIAGESLVQTTVPNSTIRVINPAGNLGAITLPIQAGGSRQVASTLIIEQLA
jgi:hypothetical protein